MCRLWNSSLKKFDPKLNLDQLQKCLVKVIREGHHSIDSIHEVAEFEAYHLLINLGASACAFYCLTLSSLSLSVFNSLCLHSLLSGNSEVLNHVLSLQTVVKYVCTYATVISFCVSKRVTLMGCKFVS